MSDDEKYIKNVASGLLFEDDDIYWAGKDRIVRLKKDGKVVWEKPLPQSSVSRSSLILQDSLLYMLNYGETEKGKETTSYGNPFVAAYNKDDGLSLIHIFTRLYHHKRKNTLSRHVKMLSIILEVSPMP